MDRIKGKLSNRMEIGVKMRVQAHAPKNPEKVDWEQAYEIWSKTKFRRLINPKREDQSSGTGGEDFEQKKAEGPSDGSLEKLLSVI